MHSGELARLAGVTVRALRHYHQVGVLAEPARGTNGYRDYSVHDLVRVLKIRRLASLGIPLERMAGLLDEPDADSLALLDELDAELENQIEQLTKQRALVRRLRDHRTPLDVPPELAPFLAVFASETTTKAMSQVDRDHSVLLAHFVGDEGMEHLTGLYEQLSTPELLAPVMALSDRFERLCPETSEQEINDLAAAFAENFAPVLSSIRAFGESEELQSTNALLAKFSNDLLNPQQVRMLAVLETRLDASEREAPAPATPGTTSAISVSER
ncbi:MerR family transcriptional regulator [Humidisolicoccus flavus]|uniref:MerR family transcriptional regulator n=1 Tax=Humidisolicoccus flavus TaxID=3111414 RepID=UPI0032539E6F